MTNLLSSRNALLPSKSETPTEQGDAFDLVTWVITQSQKNRQYLNTLQETLHEALQETLHRNRL